MNRCELEEYVLNLCRKAGEPEGSDKAFLKMMESDERLMREFEYYAEHNDFACGLKIDGLTVVDILVWQVDRFKAAIDEGRFELKYNGPHMVLSAFYTMGDVIKNPERYKERFNCETGSDYPGKTMCT